MKKSSVNFMGRKNQSLFDTDIKLRDVDHFNLTMDSVALPESGTASVRARPTVKHHASSDTFQGIAVPTPKVPLLPPPHGAKMNGSVGNPLVNGSALSVPDLVEGEILVPPPPSVAPPPPPGTFILPPPDFMGDLNSSELAHMQLPFVPAPQTPSVASLGANKSHIFPKRPSVPPPNIPTSPMSPISPTGRVPGQIPQRPTHAPPQPPVGKPKTQKTPPTKPSRTSSVPFLDLPPNSPPTPPPVQTPTLSTFNPQSPAKLFNVPQPPVLGGFDGRDPKLKKVILLDDSGFGNSAPKLASPSKPAPRDAQQLMENLRSPLPSNSPSTELKEKGRTGPVDISSLLPSAPLKSAQLLKPNGTVPTLESTRNNNGRPSSDQPLKFSPLLDRKLRNLKPDSNASREGAAASPLALLMAAKKREKHRPVGSSAQDEGATTPEHQSTSWSDSSPHSFGPSSSSSPPSNGERLQESSPSALLENTQKYQAPVKYDSSALAKTQIPSAASSLNHTTKGTSPTMRNQLQEKPHAHANPSKPSSGWPKKQEPSLPVLPPPPEFGDAVDFKEPPPFMPPPPPVKKQPTPTATPFVPAPPPPPKVVPAAPPKFSPADLNVKLKPTPRSVPAQMPDTLSASQVTLLSILQKKMLEMDQRMNPVEVDSSSDDWGSPLSDEETHAIVIPKPQPQSKSQPAANRTAATVDMRELESKMGRKPPEASTVKLPSTGHKQQQQQSKHHQYGMTLTVRPGTRNPITVVRRGDQ